MTVTAWAVAQNGLLDLDEPILWDYIEGRTFGKRWSQDVGIAFHADDDRLVRAAYDLEKRRQSDENTADASPPSAG